MVLTEQTNIMFRQTVFKSPGSLNHHRNVQIDASTTSTYMPVNSGGRLPGWGVVFGSFASKAKAQETIKRNRTALKSLARRGRPAIIPKTRKGLQRYSALLVGLKQADAGQACQQLRKSNERPPANPI